MKRFLTVAVYWIVILTWYVHANSDMNKLTDTNSWFVTSYNDEVNTFKEFQNSQLMILQHPDRLLNWISDKYWFIEKRSIVDKMDKADITFTEIKFIQWVNKLGFVYPQWLKKMKIKKSNFNPCSGMWKFDCHPNYGNKKCELVKIEITCSDWLCSKNNYNIYSNLDAKEGTEISFYNSKAELDTMNHLDKIVSYWVTININNKLPNKFPRLEYANWNDNKWLSYNLINKKWEMVDWNMFIKDWWIFSFPKEDFISYAKINWNWWLIYTNLIWKIHRDIWIYTKFERKFNVYYKIRYCEVIEYWKWRYSVKIKEKPHQVKQYSIPIFKWNKKIPWQELNFEFNDSATIDVYSSSAWIQTKWGNMWTNKEIISEKTQNSTWRYVNDFFFSKWDTFFDNSIINSPVTSQPKDYSPKDQYNAQYMIFTKQKYNDLNEAEFNSESNWYTFIEDKIGNWKKIYDFDLSVLNEGKYWFWLRWYEYDKWEGLWRNYEEDLIEKQQFWKVIDFSLLSKVNMKKLWNIVRHWSTYTITEMLNLKAWQIYYFPEWSILNLWNKYSDLLIKWWSAKIYIKWNVNINWNIFYAIHKWKNYHNMSNLRIEAEIVNVSGDVEFIESQIKTWYFYSWESTLQLKILWDLIATETHFQRLPAWISNPEEYDVNPPSELIIEDLRKYLIPTPWDTTYRWYYTKWEQVNPLTWEYEEPY